MSNGLKEREGKKQGTQRGVMLEVRMGVKERRMKGMKEKKERS